MAGYLQANRHMTKILLRNAGVAAVLFLLPLILTNQAGFAQLTSGDLTGLIH